MDGDGLCAIFHRTPPITTTTHIQQPQHKQKYQVISMPYHSPSSKEAIPYIHAQFSYPFLFVSPHLPFLPCPPTTNKHTCNTRTSCLTLRKP